MNKETKVRTRQLGAIAVSVAAALALAACGSSSSSSSSGGNPARVVRWFVELGLGRSGGSATLNGAGSTLAAPIYQQWGSTLKSQGLTINFNPVGSGAGIADLQTATVQFAGSDPALKPTDTAKMKGPTLQFPVAFGGITVSYNLSGVKSGLKLDGPTIANIFLGKIKKWNDPAIKALNPGMSLPSTSITVIHRSDSSGTTKGFTTFLEDYSPSGSPRSAPTRRSSGRSAPARPRTPASRPRSSRPRARSATSSRPTRWRTASPTRRSRTRTASTCCRRSPTPRWRQSASRSPRTSGSRRSTPAARAPTRSSRQTFLDVYKDPCKSGGASTSTASGLKKFLTYAFGAGQQTLGSGGSKLPYAPLPSSLAAKDNAQLSTMTCNGSPIS